MTTTMVRFTLPSVSNRTLVLGMTGLLALPTILAAFQFRPLPATFLIAACVGGILMVSRDPSFGPRNIMSRRADLWLLAGCIAGAASLLIYSGSLHIFYATLDWRIRDAVLADLSAGGFPASYRVADEDFLLRAPLGMYIVPASVGLATSLLGAHFALWIQNSLALGVIIYFISVIGLGVRHALLLLMSGTCAVLPISLLWMLGESPQWTQMAMFGADAWHPNYQYTSTIVQYFWVPNHAIPGWWLAVVFLLSLQDELDGASIVATAAVALFWSPLAIIATPVLLLGRLHAHLKNLRVWLSVSLAAGFTPLLVYFLADASTIPWSTAQVNVPGVKAYILFVVALAPQTAFIIIYRELLQPTHRHLVIISVVILLALPGMSFGTSNDLVMRGSIVPLAILWYSFAYLVLQVHADRQRYLHFAWVTVALCSLSATGTLATHHLYTRWNISDCSVIQSARQFSDSEVSPHYHARWSALPRWLIDRGSEEARPTAPRYCWSFVDDTPKYTQSD